MVFLAFHTFIARLIRRISDKNFTMIRYVGLFSNRWRKQYIAQAHLALNQSAPEDSDQNTAPSWAQCQTEYRGIGPFRKA